MTIQGTPDDDKLKGTSGANTFDLTQGGDDTAKGGKGDDSFLLGGALTSHDRIIGGDGFDSVYLDGDYSGVNKIKFGSETLQSIERIVLAGGHTYNITTSFATILSPFTLDATGMVSGDKLIFNALVDASAGITFNAGAGKDTIIGGSQSDVFNMGSHLTAGDSLDGGAGINEITLDGHTHIVMNDATIRNIAILSVNGGHNYNLEMADGNVAAGKTLNIFVSTLMASDTFVLNGSAEKDGLFNLSGDRTFGHYNLTGGDGNDLFNLSDGAAGSTAIIHGSLGADTVYAEAAEGGTDTFIYTNVAQSTGRDAHDSLGFVNFGTDHMKISGYTCSGTSVVTNQTINYNSFDSDLAGAVAGHMSSHGATLVYVDNGTYFNHVFLVVDLNGDAAFTDGHDYVFDVGANQGALTTAFFT